MRPAKIKGAIARRWFERRVGGTPLSDRGLPMDLGTAYGGWMLPVAVMRRSWLCYSVGTGGDISFDVELIRRFDARVRSFDPVQEFVDYAADEMRDEPRFTVLRAAITVADGPVRMQRTHHPGSKAVSADGLFDTDDWEAFPGRSLPSLMAEYGDQQIDVLKMDIEGTEYDLLPSLDLPGLGVKVLAVCLHHNRSVRPALELIDYLAGLGYEAVAMRPAVKTTFAHRAVLEDEQRGPGGALTADPTQPPARGASSRPITGRRPRARSR